LVLMVRNGAVVKRNGAVVKRNGFFFWILNASFIFFFLIDIFLFFLNFYSFKIVLAEGSVAPVTKRGIHCSGIVLASVSQ